MILYYSGHGWGQPEEVLGGVCNVMVSYGFVVTDGKRTLDRVRRINKARTSPDGRRRETVLLRPADPEE